MEALIYLDTHVAAWLYAGRVDLLSATAAELLNGAARLVISPMVTLELEYLYEIGRTGEGGAAVIEELRQAIDLEVCDLPFERVVARSLTENWTRDPFDRLIVSQSALRGASLLTKDQTIHQHYAGGVWE